MTYHLLCLLGREVGGFEGTQQKVQPRLVASAPTSQHQFRTLYHTLHSISPKTASKSHVVVCDNLSHMHITFQSRCS